MYAVVGSGNPVKRRATVRAAPEGWTVEASAVPSGVAEQPTGRSETVAGAENRARAALETAAPTRSGPDDGTERPTGGDAGATAALGVGIEGGVARPDGLDGLWLIMWAAATDGDRTGRGGGPTLRLPDRIAERVDGGEELGPVMDDVLGESGVARDRGAAGALTGGAIDRERALAAAVAGALGPFVTDHY